MFKSLFLQKKTKKREPSCCRRLLYAIGDVHGRMDLLGPLLRTIRDDIATIDHGTQLPLIIFLGDYIDRGPSSRAVVDAILELRQDPSLEVRALKGNHEQALLLFLESAEFGRTWLAHGGAATLSSYGVALPGPRAEPEVYEATRQTFRAALSPEHQEFYETLGLYSVQDDYAFVHAGVRWGVPLDQQTEEDILWIRQGFLYSPEQMEQVIVHGHTPVEQPYMGDNRIGIDTGAYATGLLSAVRLWNTSRDLLYSR